MNLKFENQKIKIVLDNKLFDKIVTLVKSLFTEKVVFRLVALVLILISAYGFYFYYQNQLGLAYNDARSHLDIGRRVVEGLKPGLAQLGSVWLPLPHALMLFTIWDDFMWHSGLAGAIVNMVSFVVTGILIYKILKELEVSMLGRIVGILIFVLNINILYLQSTAMTELLLLATMTAGAYELLLWHKNDNVLYLIKAAFYIMLSTLTRYDGWFLLFIAAVLVVIKTFRAKGYKASEGTFILFCTLGGLGVVLWLLWNALIFKDPLYFAFGPFSAHSQQLSLEDAGVLITKHDWYQSLRFYMYAFVYNSGAVPVIIGIIGSIYLFFDKRLTSNVKLAMTALLAPFAFNVLALYLGHSVLFIQGLSGDTWFNVRYGIMLMPSIGVFGGYLIDRARYYAKLIIPLLMLSTFFMFYSNDAVTIDDARVGSSQKNVTEVSGYLSSHANDNPGYVLISVASHDAIIFSSGLPMKRFIHEGTGLYWQDALAFPDRWARWIVMRTYDDNDLAWKNVKDSPGLQRYDIVGKFPFADIYELKPEYIDQLKLDEVYKNQK